MPIRAIVDGIDKSLSLLSNEECFQLKKDIKLKNLSVTMPCCNAKGHLKSNEKNTFFFAHNPGHRKNCQSKPESHEHRELKKIIHLACIDAGFEAIPEYSENANYRPDVYAFKGNVKVAFEIQLSSQSYLDTLRRQKKYNDDHVHCCWLFEKLPERESPFDSEYDNLKMFELIISGNDEFKVINAVLRLSVYDFVRSYLNDVYQLSLENNHVQADFDEYARSSLLTDEELEAIDEFISDFGRSLWKWVCRYKYLLIFAGICLSIRKLSQI